ELLLAPSGRRACGMAHSVFHTSGAPLARSVVYLNRSYPWARFEEHSRGEFLPRPALRVLRADDAVKFPSNAEGWDRELGQLGAICNSWCRVTANLIR